MNNQTNFNNVNFRVYRRNFDQLILLWDKRAIPDNTTINILVEDNHKLRNVEFSLAPESIFGNEKINNETYMAGLLHEKNGLDPNKEYTFILEILGDGHILSSHKLNVLRVGMLPDTEKDKKEAHSQTFMWDYEGKLWAKAPLIKVEHGDSYIYAVPVVIVGN